MKGAFQDRGSDRLTSRGTKRGAGDLGLHLIPPFMQAGGKPALVSGWRRLWAAPLFLPGPSKPQAVGSRAPEGKRAHPAPDGLGGPPARGDSAEASGSCAAQPVGPGYVEEVTVPGFRYVPGRQRAPTPPLGCGEGLQQGSGFKIAPRVSI